MIQDEPTLDPRGGGGAERPRAASPPGVTPGAEQAVATPPPDDVTEEISRAGERLRSHLDRATAATARHMPKKIGHYTIKRLIGEGGIGAVYEAVQTQPRRTVAVKVLRSGSVSPSSLRRFEYESQLLARLRHPGIAQVFEAGTHDDGVGGPVPYFAMEYIPGAQSLTHFAAASELGTRQRLELFIKVCDAVQHGHQKGIIHRDLKPANILIDTSSGAEGQPKIIDFGVARGTDSDMAGATLQTEAGMLVGTVAYMSPEQVAADPNDIDVRSDVYALGLILYQLLSGKLPYDISSNSIYAATRIIREQAPVRLSAVNVALRGDIETIVLKAIEKDRAKRYQSAADLASDIQRFLNNEPILARPVGALGRCVRWVRRNRTIATVTGVAAAVLIVVTAALAAQIVSEGRRAQRNYEEAQKNLAVAEENLSAKNDSFELLKQMFTSIRPEDNKQGMVDVESILTNASRSVEHNPPKLAATEANIREFLGTAYRGLSVYTRAAENLKRALELREKTSPDPSPELASALHEYAACLWWNGEYDKAAPLYERALAMRRKLTPGDNAAVSQSLTHLGANYLRQGRYEESERLYAEALAMRRRLFGAKHEEVAAALNNLARLAAQREHYDRAETLFREALEMISDIKGPSDSRVASALTNLAGCLLSMGKVDEAEASFADALAIRSAIYKPDHHLVATAKLGLGRAAFAAGNLAEARRLADASVAALSQINTEHPDLGSALELQGEVLAATGRADEAEPILRRALRLAEQARPPVRLDIAETKASLGTCLVKLAKYDEAESVLLDSLRVIRSERGDASEFTARAASRVIDMYQAQGRSDRAEAYRKLAAGTNGR